MSNKYVLLALACACACARGVSASTLEADFLTPPMATRPHVWWHWPGYNVTSNGIARDLKTMHDAGIGGAMIFAIASHSGKWCGTPMKNTLNPGMTYGDEKWWGFVRYAAETAAKYGMTVGLHNSPGFSCSGGPWIKPDHAMKRLVWTVAPEGQSPAEPSHGDFGRYREIGTATFAGHVYRFGYVSCNYRTKPCPEDIEPRSLECDKMSAAAVKCHIDNFLEPIKDHLGPLVGTSFKQILMDSYEAEHCDWTDGFREEFTKRRGYDPLPYLPVFAGADLPDAKRFREDHARTVAELYTENHYRQMQARVNAHNLEFQLEPYGGPFDGYEAARHSDTPMVEFWMPDIPWWWINPDGIGGYPAATGASGRAFGRKVIAAEAFTGFPTWAQFSESPRDFKVPGDASYARGINRLTLHDWVHQPFDPKWKPGNTMGFWGSHFGENQTWYEPGKAWYRYLGRCQALLQRGEQVVDQLALCDSPAASEFDAIAVSSFLNELTVLPDGRLRMPSGRTYRLLRLPRGGLMGSGIVSPAVARRVREILAQGATIWAPKRFVRAEGLKDCEAADAEVRAIAAELWDRPHPRFFTGTVEEALASLGILPGFEVLSANDRRRPVLASHRAEPGADWFFVANLSTNEVRPTMAFRVTGRVPEIWDPDTAVRRPLTYWREDNSRTILTETIAPESSFFVVFRTIGRPQGVEEKPLVDGPATELDGHWRVTFEKGRGAPEEEVVFGRLESLSTIDVPGIRYFSGTATYRKKFLFMGYKWLNMTDGSPSTVAKFRGAAKRIVLDLGDVRDIAEVTVNGKFLGTLWHPPYVVDATDALIDDYNTIEIKVTNTWHNRLIGDKREPDDCTWGESNTESGNFAGRPIERIPDFVINDTPRPSSGRIAFSVWDYFGINSPLHPAGLIGPVLLRSKQ